MDDVVGKWLVSELDRDGVVYPARDWSLQVLPAIRLTDPPTGRARFGSFHKRSVEPLLWGKIDEVERIVLVDSAFPMNSWFVKSKMKPVTRLSKNLVELPKPKELTGYQRELVREVDPVSLDTDLWRIRSSGRVGT